MCVKNKFFYAINLYEYIKQINLLNNHSTYVVYYNKNK